MKDKIYEYIKKQDKPVGIKNILWNLELGIIAQTGHKLCLQLIDEGKLERSKGSDGKWYYKAV